jgi:NAD(P)-dependent dehydrogenase (short-subunit alcohol dehydrogenase family)
MAKPVHTKSIMITGGASGIGAALARQAAQQGHRVLVADVDQAGGRRVVADIGERAAFVPLDIRSEQQWNAALDGAWRTFGRLDVLINNAAIVRTGYARNVAAADHAATLDVNAMGPMRGMLATLPRFREQGFGHFVTVCSMTAFLPFPGLASYAAAKAALRAFHLGLAMEERDSPIAFTIVHPTSTETPMLEAEAASDEVPMAFLSETVTADYVAEVVLTAMQRKRLEVFMPPERANFVRALGTNASRLMKIAAQAEALGAHNLAQRRAQAE